MIISHKHKFIFMHSRKTGGSTLATKLNRFLGPKDIQIGAWVDTIESGGSFNLDALMKSTKFPVKTLLSSIKYSFKERRIAISPEAVNTSIKKYYKNKSEGKLMTHSSAELVKSFFPEIWNDYTKFAFVRNPFSHAVSDYYWRKHLCGNVDISFEEFIYRLEDKNRPDPEGIRPPIISNWPVYTIDDRVAVDFLGCFETLDKDIDQISNILNLPLGININSAKGNIRKKNKSIESHYSEDLIKRVRRIYSKEIDYFGYSPFSSLPSINMKHLK
jgi:hypothetical protein